MTGQGLARWGHDGWRGWIDLDAGVSPGHILALAASASGRRSRHAWTRPIAAPALLWLKTYPAPDGRRARRAWRMATALRARGFGAPETILVGTRQRAGVLLMRDVGGRSLLDAVSTTPRRERRRLLGDLGRAVGRLHADGFVHGDLVPSNIQVGDGGIVFLDNDRTRRAPLLVWWAGRRNLVQLGRFVVPGVEATDRARVLRAYADARGLSRRGRHRLARWLVGTTLRRRCEIDAIPREAAERAGFAALMRSGGAFDPSATSGRGRE